MNKNTSELKSIIVIAEEYYPAQTGFSLAFQNFQKAIIKYRCVSKVYVIAQCKAEDPHIDGVEFYKVSAPKNIRTLKGLCMIGAEKAAETTILCNRFKEYKTIIENILKKDDVSMILVESMFLGWTVPFIRKYFDIPCMVRIHGTGPEYTKNYKDKSTRFNEALLKWSFESKYFSATTSYYFDFFKDYWSDYNHFMDRYFFIIPNTAEFEYVPYKDNDEFVLLQLGRMDKFGYHQKGFTDTIQALLYLEEVLDQEQLQKIKYITIGTGIKEEGFKRLLANLKYIKIEHYDKVPNSVVREKLCESSVVLIPSRCEGMSMFATEALATGRPFIFTSNNGMKSMIIDKYNGLAVNEYDYLNMASAIVEYLKNNELVMEYGYNSRILFENEFTYKKVAQKFNVILKTLDATEQIKE